MVVLGSTGRNFAAGMSGGVAYVLNAKNDFDYYCNMEMVELSLVEDLSDTRELKSLISKHQQFPLRFVHSLGFFTTTIRVAFLPIIIMGSTCVKSM